MVKPLAIALLLVAGQWRAATAPGPSSRAHQKVEDNCDACHTPFKGVPNEKCLACHKELRQFHAKVAAQKCTACHGEHKGPDADLTRPEARAAFDHGLTGMPLLGAHAKVACATCHSKPIGQMGDSCAACHKDPHQGALGNACGVCHASTTWTPPLHTRAEHKEPMEGGHAKSGCADCHAKGAHLKPVVACGECHEQAHGGTTAPCDGCHQVSAWKPARFDHSFCTCILPQKHQTVGCLGCHRDFDFKHAPSVCSGCHEKERKHEPLGECSLCHSAVSWKKNEFDHNKRAKFKITGKHLGVSCENCHPAQGATLKFRGVPTSCEGCHQQQGDKAHGNFGPCSKCHDNDGWDKSKFDHASTGFPLDGRHAKLACQDCHAEKTKGYPRQAPPKKAEWAVPRGTLAWLAANDVLPMPLVLSAPAPTPAHAAGAACSHCHQDPHAGSTAKLGECSACHGFEKWRPSSFDADRHAATSYPLVGQHREVECALCHEGDRFDQAQTQCNQCHVDRHRGLLGDACEKCHTPQGFTPVEGFDHLQTGFALVGGHANVPCAGCHKGARGKAMAQSKTPGACATCHQPKHGPELGADCAKCHDPAKGGFWSARGMAFPHEQTGFPLERRHATVACGACHKAAGPPPTPRCAECHFDPHSGQLGADCGDCHVPDRFRLVRFDHDRTGWPLRGRHFTTPCTKCHTAQRWVGLTDDCYDCHAADAARGKAKVPQAHGFGPLDCAGCHTSQWRW